MQEYNLWTSKTLFPKKHSPKRANVQKKSLLRIPTAPVRFPLTHKHNFKNNVCLNCGAKKRFPMQIGRLKSPASPVKFSLYKVASPKKGKILSASAVEFVPQKKGKILSASAVEFVPQKKGKKLSASAVEFVPQF